ncbi:MAG: PIN domain-containing protein [Candidatus Aminicenantes bacterium]|nr:PIN domain-containing protein [Candidatus Aminicenantes bacterium]NIM81656.1 PIN domain-containing protein [Candidatus Aminicenantes bacterium]NIN21026.1 PIN domain-containing protein [Candidatus Aminicenantes bacterium]NIN44847.1 PIN domain-containing protein [Candidatus Aminicenantes bacterium]NIN87655.1 PIN domain-containing protein [Candidatus Aminicenantes bacterium]
MKLILDAHGLMVFLEKEPGYEKIESLFTSAVEKDDYLLITSVNLGEVFYIILRECGEEKAQEVEEIVQNLPLEVIDADWNLTREAAKLKAFKKMSYADCFAAALAIMHMGELITGDPEFKAVENQIKILWINSI